MFPERLVEEGSWRPAAPAEDGGWRFDVRLPWYRALPLSCVEEIEVLLDGVQVESSRVSLTLEGHRFALAELAARHDVWWYVTDSATVQLAASTASDQPAPPPAGPVELTATIGLVIPYLPVDGEPLHIVESCTRTFAAAATSAVVPA